MVACATCGGEFTVSGRGKPVYCSRACANRSPKHVANARSRKKARNALKRGVFAERFTHEEIAERDAWKCHLCGRKVTRKTWSIDHLVPVSKGGAHTRANVRLAHHRCNTLRRTGGQVQLLLVG